jgi:hypothetical protein
MSVYSDLNLRFNVFGRLALTLAVAAAAVVSLIFVSGSVRAVEHINRTDDTLAELSQYIAEGHGSIRALVATPGSSADEALSGFAQAVDRRVARLRTLKTLVQERAVAYLWTQPLQESVDVERIDKERRAYVIAATATPIGGDASDSAKGLRLFDLRARKLMITVAAMRDTAETARSQALFAAEGFVAVSSGVGGLLIAYLIWFPVFTRTREDELAGARHV